ncbi:MAG: PEP-CTERM sorting domain-containing protein, partial [Desulfobacca sp.]|uniref:PEP-CTERM sorting domain-containing protein n=1 Tax=Desulfobacca sp. TaxID=2067990 RepID=UPI0040499825
VDIGPSYPGEPSQPTVPGYTAVEMWLSGQTPGNNYAGSNKFYDVIGNRFATDKISISASPSTFVIQIWTNNQPGGWTVSNKNWGVADLAINATAGTAAYDGYTISHFPNAVSRFEWGINMQAYAAGTPGQPGGGTNNVFLADVRKWETSFTHANPVAGLRYGGAYKADAAPAGSELAPVETNMVDYTKLYSGDMIWVVNDPSLDFNNNIPDYLITITFPFLVGSDIEYLWGTARCANDVVIVTPLPGSLVLMGSALLGLVGIGLRRRQVS